MTELAHDPAEAERRADILDQYNGRGRFDSRGNFWPDTRTAYGKVYPTRPDRTK